MTMVTGFGEVLDVKPSLVPTTVLRKLVVIGRVKLVNFEPLVVTVKVKKLVSLFFYGEMLSG